MRFNTLKQLAKFLFCEIKDDKPLSGMCIDSRLIKPGELFWALKGDRVDGHQYLQEIASKGAIGAVVSNQYHGPDYGLTLIRVADPLQAFQECAKHLVASRNVRVAAITGSIGKTTSKDFIKTFLATKYRVAASPGNSNSQVGIPLTIFNHTKGDEEILILEMGMTLPGHIKRLVEIAPPEVALITTVALVHACNFNSLDDIARAKAEIFSHPRTNLGIFPKEIGAIATMARCNKISFSIGCPDADFYLNPLKPSALHVNLEKVNVSIGAFSLPGKHNVHNMLAAISVARSFNLSWEEIKMAIPLLQLPERRLQFIQQRGIQFLNDSYNASELSVKSALETLPAAQKGGNKIAVLGSMMELGKFSAECHKSVGEFALEHVDAVYCLGEECKPIYEIFTRAGKPAGLFLNRSDLVKHLKQALKPNDVVLLKGSRSKELWKVLEEI